MKTLQARKLLSLILCGAALVAGTAVKSATANEPNLVCASGARPLADVMQDMNTISKALTSQIADATRNPDSVSKASQMEELAIESLTLCVPKLEKMADAAAKHGEYLEYQKAITQLFNLEIELEQGLLKNDNAAAATTFGKMKELQRTAHARFRG